MKYNIFDDDDDDDDVFSFSLSLSPPMSPAPPRENHSCAQSSRQLGLSPALLRRQSSQNDLASAERCLGSRSGSVAAAASVAVAEAAATREE